VFVLVSIAWQYAISVGRDRPCKASETAYRVGIINSRQSKFLRQHGYDPEKLGFYDNIPPYQEPVQQPERMAGLSNE
jgi:hypothetical protein